MSLAKSWLLAFFAIIVLVAWAVADDTVDRRRIDALAEPYVENNVLYGAAIGIVSPQGVQYAGYGRISREDPRPPDERTVFEIGSITKVFTGLLLALLAEERLVSLNDPLQDVLDERIRIPRVGRPITLLDLATHTAGLPRMPNNFRPRDHDNPFADYTVEQLAAYMKMLRPARAPGERTEYSNLGMGLLGHALAAAGGAAYEELVTTRICEPLDLANTCITLDTEQRARLAEGHDEDNRRASNWELPTLAGAGALRSTVEDMLTFLAANIPLHPTTLDSAIAASHVVRFRDPPSGNDLALAWHVRRNDGVFWHNGETGGYHCYIAYSPTRRVGVAVLSNTATHRVDDLGAAILKMAMAASPAPAPQQAQQPRVK